MKNRRDFIIRSALMSAGLLYSPWFFASCGQEGGSGKAAGEGQPEADASKKAPFFKISLAEWSLNRTIFGKKIDHLDFPKVAKNDFGIDAVEYVNQFFKDKAKDKAYLGQMKQICDDLDVKSLLIMVDGEGGLGMIDKKERLKAVENHYKWVEAAQFLGCHSIRVNAYGEGSNEAVGEAATEGLSKLADFAKDFNINVIVENHGGISSNGTWLSTVIKNGNRPNLGTLPDFGNFCIKRSEPKEQTMEAWLATVCLEEYDRYEGVTQLMPYAKGVSAKTNGFKPDGSEMAMDYKRLMQIVKDAGYTGYVGIEFEGAGEEYEGIRATKALLEKVGAEIG